jgi:hypothetical protein
LEDVYNCDETPLEEQAAAYQQHSEAQFASLRDQIEALSKQVANVGGCREHQHISSPHVSKQSDGDGSENPFVELGVHGHQPLIQAHANQWEFGFKLNIPKFQGVLQPEEFLDWVAVVEEILDYKGVAED